MNRRVLVSAALVGALLAPPAVGRSSSAAGPSIEPFRGLGAWVDIFEDGAWERPAKAVADMAGHGVRTLYLQTSNYSQDDAIVHTAGVARFLAAAHRRGIRVVAWYLPGFAKLARDFQRSMAAIRYRSAAGERFDAFALDIESSILGPPSERSKRLIRLSKRIRAKAGAGYTLGAIIPSPVGIKLNKGYWPKFPYDDLANTYDAFIPMGYFTYHVEGAEKVHDETARNVEIIREATDNPAIPIHMIGGIADDASGAEVEAFVHAVREHGLIGASIYNWTLTEPHDWEPLETVPANPKQSPPLPLTLPFAGTVGNVAGEDRTHPKEVVYRTSPVTGSRTLGFEAYDVQADEVHIWVNWRLLEPVPTSGADAWSPRQEVTIPDGLLDDEGENVIAFVASGEEPDWTEWGVRAVSLT
jgi:hypothetical protein